MSTKQKLMRALGYCSFTFSCLFLSIYLTFPGRVLGQRLAHEIEAETKGKVQISIEDMSLSGFTGVSAEGVSVRYDAGNGELYRLELDAIAARLAILPLFTLSTVLDARVRAGKGVVDVEVEPLGGGAFQVDGEIEDLNLMRVNALSHLAGLPIMGTIGGDVSLHWTKQAKTREGHVTLSATGLRVGPGEVSSGALGKLKVPAVGFGDLALGFKVGDGKLELDKFEQKGGDLLANISGDVSLRPRFSSSSVSGCVKIKGEPSYLSKNPTLKSALELATVRLKKDGAEFLNIPLAGTVGSVRMRGGLCKNTKAGARGKRRPEPRR